MLTFAEFHKEATGHDPYEWLTAVQEAWARGDWIDRVKAPTGSGKSYLFVAWLYNLYADAVAGRRQTPVRCFVFVNRRMLVDDAHALAVSVAKRLSKRPRLAEVREVFKKLSGTDTPLVVGTMHGGVERAVRNHWMDNPLQPTLVSTTVPQLGSRVLFRGYGVPSRQRSMHAAMTTYDCMWLADEPHLSVHCVGLLAQIRGMVSRTPIGNLPESRLVLVGATIPGNGRGNDFDPAAQSAELRRRLSAPRPITLHDASEVKYAAAVPAILAGILAAHPKARVGIYCNTVGQARKIHGLVSTKHRSALFNGRVRGHERAALVEKHYPEMKGEVAADTPFVAVMTQTGEAGIDADFDHVITIACPYDSLRQRVGRCNRRGLNPAATVHLVLTKDPDPIYGGVGSGLFAVLKEMFPDLTVPNINDPALEVALDRFTAALTERATLAAPTIDQLAHTHPGPPVNIDKLVHGHEHEIPTAHIVYCRELTPNGLAEALDDPVGVGERLIALIRYRRWPRPQEILTIPLSCLDAEDDDTPDLFATAGELGQWRGKPYPVLIFDGENFRIANTSDVKNGESVFVPQEWGRHDSYGFNPMSEAPVEDVGEAYREGHIRIHPTRHPDRKIPANLSRTKVRKLLRKVKDEGGPAAARAKSLLKNDQWGYYPTPDGHGVDVRRVYKDNPKEVLLEPHSLLVQEVAEDFCRRMGISGPLLAAVSNAARLHDIGKADRRLQRFFRGGDDGELLAKSAIRGRQHRRGRHELQSAEMAHASGLLVDEGGLDLHLIASHHGWGRPFFPLKVDKTYSPFMRRILGVMVKSDKPSSVFMAARGFDAFWELNRKYGPWGLAMLETIVRLADWTASRRADQ